MEANVTRANLALMVAILAAIFTGWQALDSSQRNARDALREKEDRTPIILIAASRPTAEREFYLKFQFQNREYAKATIQSVTLVAPANAVLVAIESNQMVFNPRDSIPAPEMSGPALRMAKLKGAKTMPVNVFIDVRSQVIFSCYVAIPEEDNLPRGTTAFFDVKLNLHDNADTEVTVRRFVKLVP